MIHLISNYLNSIRGFYIWYIWHWKPWPCRVSRGHPGHHVPWHPPALAGPRVVHGGCWWGWRDLLSPNSKAGFSNGNYHFFFALPIYWNKINDNDNNKIIIRYIKNMRTYMVKVGILLRITSVFQMVVPLVYSKKQPQTISYLLNHKLKTFLIKNLTTFCN